MTRNDWRSNWNTSGEPVRRQYIIAAMSKRRGWSSWTRACGGKGWRKLKEFGGLLITSCQMMIWGRECCWLGIVRKRKIRRSWCWSVLWGNLAKWIVECNPGNAARQRRRPKTPPGSVFTAAARELAPKVCISKQQARELEPKRVSG